MVTHKVAHVDGLSIYFNADSKSMDVAQHVAAGAGENTFDAWTECVL